jgi:glycerol-3-phosphate acyltransferase PlsY
VFFRFVGGKGVATALGVLLGLNVWLGLATLVTWLVVAYAFRYSSLAALVAAVFAPFYYGLLFGADEKLFAVVAMSALLLYRHGKKHRQPDGRQGIAHRQQRRRRQAEVKKSKHGG